MTGYWIEDIENKEFGFETLTAAKRRARVLMARREKKGDISPIVHVIANDNSHAWLFDCYAQCWHEDA